MPHLKNLCHPGSCCSVRTRMDWTTAAGKNLSFEDDYWVGTRGLEKVNSIDYLYIDAIITFVCCCDFMCLCMSITSLLHGFLSFYILLLMSLMFPCIFMWYALQLSCNQVDHRQVPKGLYHSVISRILDWPVLWKFSWGVNGDYDCQISWPWEGCMIHWAPLKVACFVILPRV